MASIFQKLSNWKPKKLYLFCLRTDSETFDLKNFQNKKIHFLINL